MSTNHTKNPTIVTTDEVGSLIADMLALSKDPIDSGVEGEGVYLERAGSGDLTDLSNLTVELSNGQIFTVRIIAGDRS